MHHMFTASFRVLVVGGGLFTAVVCSSPAQADGATLNGQPTQGRISGVALDADDSPLADHTIELNVILDQGGREERQLRDIASSDAAGRFSFERLPPGTFRLRVLRQKTLVATSPPLLLLDGAMEIRDVVVGPPAAVARSMDEVMTRIKPGTRVAVIDTAGNETTGRVARLSESALTLADGRTLPDESILRISRDGDGLLNGLAIGAGIGAATGLAIGTAWCSDSIGRHCLPGKVHAESTAFWALTGAGAGLLFDWMRSSRELIFQARPPRRASARPAVRIAPVISKKSKGLVLSLAW